MCKGFDIVSRRKISQKIINRFLLKLTEAHYLKLSRKTNIELTISTYHQIAKVSTDPLPCRTGLTIHDPDREREREERENGQCITLYR
jgi:hypothetical protein